MNRIHKIAFTLLSIFILICFSVSPINAEGGTFNCRLSLITETCEVGNNRCDDGWAPDASQCVDRPGDPTSCSPIDVPCIRNSEVTPTPWPGIPTPAGNPSPIGCCISDSDCPGTQTCTGPSSSVCEFSLGFKTCETNIDEELMVSIPAYDLCINAGDADDVAACRACTKTGENGVPTGDENTGVYTAIGCIPVSPVPFVQAVLKFAAGTGGGVSLLIMLAGVFIVATAGANPEKIQAGMQLITSAITGLLVIIFAVVIMQFIGISIFSLPGL